VAEPAPAPDPTCAGFTLVEMLVALALAALIGLMLAQALSLTGTIAGVSARYAAAEEVQAVRDHLRRTLGDLAGRRPDGTLPAFAGGPDGVSGLLAANRDVERDAEQRLDLRAVPGPGGLDLVEGRRPVRAPAGDAGAAAPERLLGGLASLDLRYFGSPAPRRPPEWLAAWTRRDASPDLVEIRIGFPAGDRRRWAPLLVPVAVRP
jgi:general secretion pathway protein J